MPEVTIEQVESALGLTFAQRRDIHAFFHNADPQTGGFPDSYRAVMTEGEEMLRDGHGQWDEAKQKGGTVFHDAEGHLLGLNLYACPLSDERLEALLALELPHLQVLNLNQTGITRFAFTARQPALQHVNLSQNKGLTELRFEAVPQNLLSLQLYDSKIERLALPALPKLVKLDVARNGAAQITFAGACPALWYLDLSDNQLSELSLPAGFDALQYVFLRGNQLQQFAFAGRLPQLETLDLRKNQLPDLPTSLLDCPEMTHLFAHGNPLEKLPEGSIPDDERANGWEGLRSVLRSLRADDTIDNDEVRLILLGNSTAGKTSLLRYLKERTYDQQTPSTHGIKNELWRPEGLGFKVNLWDFGGQEFYHATHRLFLSRNAVNLVLFEAATNRPGELPTEITLYEQGEEVDKVIDLEHFPYTYWLKGIRHFAQGGLPPICLVESKMDKKPGQPPIEIKGEERQAFQVPPDRSFFLSVKKTAAGEAAYQAYFAIFEQKLRELLEQTRSAYQISARWIEIKEAIRARGQEQLLLTRTEYRDFCEAIRPGISAVEPGEATSMLDSLSNYLHEIGVILFYRDEPTLREVVFINPERVIDAIYRVLDYSVMKQEGRFAQAHAEEVVAQLNQEAEAKGQPGPRLEAETLLSLMEKFELIFTPKRAPGSYVAPQYLPPAIERESRAFRGGERCVHHAFSLRFLDFLPKSLMTRFICRKGHLAMDTYWKHGILFEAEAEGKRSFALVECRADQRITVHLEQPSPALISELFQVFLGLTKQHRDLEVSADGTQFVAWATLQEMREAQNPKVKATDGSWVEMQAFDWCFAERGMPVGIHTKLNKPMMKDLASLLSRQAIEVEQAFDLLEEKLSSGQQDTLRLLRSRWSRNEKSKQRETISQEHYNLERNKIENVLMDFGKGIMVDHLPSAQPMATPPSKTDTNQRPVYFSYAWKDANPEGPEVQQVIDQLFESLKADGYAPVRDSQDLPYGGSIEQFMQDLGAAPLILVFTSPRYFQSPYCMYELSEIGRNATWNQEMFRTRILPVMLEHVDFNQPATLLSYTKHWKAQEQEWREFFEEEDSADFPEQHKVYVRTKEIRRHIGKLGAWLKDINASSLSLLSEDDFAVVKQAIGERLTRLDS